jgi:hypothetical protein
MTECVLRECGIVLKRSFVQGQKRIDQIKHRLRGNLQEKFDMSAAQENQINLSEETLHELEALAEKWEANARKTFKRGELEETRYRRRFLQSEAMSRYNCAMQLRAALLKSNRISELEMDALIADAEQQ